MKTEKKFDKKRIGIVLAIVLFISFFGIVVAEEISSENKLNIYFFWGDGCPHCNTQKPYLEEWKTKYPEINVISFETWKSPENYKIFQQVASNHGIQARGVPTTFIGEKNWVGFSSSMAREMETYIEKCINEGCVDLAKDLNLGGTGSENGDENGNPKNDLDVIDNDGKGFSWLIILFGFILAILLIYHFVISSKKKHKRRSKKNGK